MEPPQAGRRASPLPLYDLDSRTQVSRKNFTPYHDPSKSLWPLKKTRLEHFPVVLPGRPTPPPNLRLADLLTAPRPVECPGWSAPAENLAPTR